ncbi:hypothetical protein [Lactiplantibacillus pentosus]|jgi:hypothetical protein|nr:hypothetical protein [Lactiplantibacillus pentosus]
MDKYDQWLRVQEEQFENEDGDELTKEDLIEAGVLADDEDQ